MTSHVQKRALGLLVLASLAVAGTGCSPKLVQSSDIELVMPDLIGMYWTDAEPHLRSIGWIGVVDKPPDVPAGIENRNRVLTQQPAAGDPLERGATITVTFGA